jgi:hypothetical protein
MNRLAALLAILVTTLVFTLTGVTVGYLISSGIHPVNSVPDFSTKSDIFVAYMVCAVSGVVAGLVISCFAVWLVGIKKD